MTRKTKPPRGLTPDEEAAWQAAAHLASPLKTKERHNALKRIKATAQEQPKQLRADRPNVTLPSVPLAQGQYAGVDKNTAERFRKGAVKMDGRLDLHGYTREEAWQKVEQFIHRHYLQGSRNLLIVTGKGRASAENPHAHAGVLRQYLPQWLTDDALRPYILAFDKAAHKDGGSGAFYVLLRRNRA